MFEPLAYNSNGTKRFGRYDLCITAKGPLRQFQFQKDFSAIFRDAHCRTDAGFHSRILPVKMLCAVQIYISAYERRLTDLLELLHIAISKGSHLFYVLPLRHRGTIVKSSTVIPIFFAAANKNILIPPVVPP